MSDIQVTVLCAVYNHEKYLEKTLDGFASQQTDFKFKVVISDDASNDNSAEILKRYEKKYPDIFEVIYQKENQYSKGKKITKDILMPKAEGKYVAICEGDDYWCDKHKLQKQYDIMQAHPEVSMCTHKTQCIYENGELSDNFFPHVSLNINSDKNFTQSEFADLLIARSTHPFQTSSYFLKIEIGMSQIVSDLMKHMSGDKAYMHSALLNGNIYYIDEVMSCYRMMSQGSWSSQIKKYSSEQKLKFFTGKIDGIIFFDNVSENKYHTEITNNYYNVLAEIMLIKDCRKEAKKIYKRYKKDYKTRDIKIKKKKIKWYLSLYVPFAVNLIYRH